MKKPRPRKIQFEETPGGTLVVKQRARQVGGPSIWSTSLYAGWADYRKALHITLGCRFHIEKHKDGRADIYVYRARQLNNQIGRRATPALQRDHGRGGRLSLGPDSGRGV